MAVVVAQFFGVIGVDFVPPSNMAELIPYLITVAIGVFLVGQVFRLVSGLIQAMFSIRRF